MAVARALARGWLRGARAWWWATAAILGLVLGAGLAASGAIGAMEAGTQERVADFFTGDVRVTPIDGSASAAPGANATQALVDGLRAQGVAQAEGRLETQFILSRRGLLQAYLEEREGFDVAVPGAASDADAYGAGLLLGLGPLASERVAPYLVAGRMPAPASEGQAVEIVLSRALFDGFVRPSERAAHEAAATAEDLAAFAFELTAGHIADGGTAANVIRVRARVVGLFDSGLAMLDRFVAIGTVEDARALVGQDPRWGGANAVTVWGASPAQASAAAPSLRIQGPAAFADDYIGQTMLVLRFMGAAIAVATMAAPLVLMWHGVQQMLDRQRRQLAVCRAIGVPATAVRGSLARLAGVLLVRSLAVALGVAAAAMLAVASTWPAWSPVPLQPVVPWLGLAATAALAVAGVALAVWLAGRSVLRDDLAMTLRA